MNITVSCVLRPQFDLQGYLYNKQACKFILNTTSLFLSTFRKKIISLYSELKTFPF